MTATPANHVVETERLILRRPLPEDAEGYTGFYLSDRAQYVGQTDKPYKAWSYFAAEIGHWEIRGWGMFAVVERATGPN